MTPQAKFSRPDFSLPGLVSVRPSYWPVAISADRAYTTVTKGAASWLAGSLLEYEHLTDVGINHD